MKDAEPYAGPANAVVGVLGGMGPLTTADFLAKVTSRTKVTYESDHLPIAIWSNPGIPDRTTALLGLGPSPVPAMADGVQRLMSVGASVIAMPCNTAHAFLRELEARTGASFLDMVGITVDDILQKHPGVRRVGVLATRGTRLAGLYTDACRTRGLQAVDVPENVQRLCVDAAIAGVKTGGDMFMAEDRLREAAAVLLDLGAEVAVAGCTEIPLIAGRAQELLPVVDATDCLAGAVVHHCRASSDH